MFYLFGNFSCGSGLFCSYRCNKTNISTVFTLQKSVREKSKWNFLITTSNLPPLLFTLSASKLNSWLHLCINDLKFVTLSCCNNLNSSTWVLSDNTFARKAAAVLANSIFFSREISFLDGDCEITVALAVYIFWSEGKVSSEGTTTALALATAIRLEACLVGAGGGTEACGPNQTKIKVTVKTTCKFDIERQGVTFSIFCRRLVSTLMHSTLIG